MYEEHTLHSEHPQKLEPALYVVATPIGNLRDITLRALDVLAAADVVAAEDTRNTAHLLTQHGINAHRLMAVHQHNEKGAAEKIVALLQAGQSVAFVSDAGTPAVSDPGALLVQAVRAAGLRVIPVPGANGRSRHCRRQAWRSRISCSMVSCPANPPHAAPRSNPCAAMPAHWCSTKPRTASSNASPIYAKYWAGSGKSCWRARSPSCSRRSMPAPWATPR